MSSADENAGPEAGMRIHPHVSPLTGKRRCWGKEETVGTTAKRKTALQPLGMSDNY